MFLRPSEVYFSQDSISCMFDKRSAHSDVRIGETLDRLCGGRCSINDIPTIRVMRRNNRWVTSDNRRLWVFRHLERLGKCETIPVQSTFYIPESKLTSFNDGKSIEVRGNAGGVWHRRPGVRKSKAAPIVQHIPTSTNVVVNNTTEKPPQGRRNIMTTPFLDRPTRTDNSSMYYDRIHRLDSQAAMHRTENDVNKLWMNDSSDEDEAETDNRESVVVDIPGHRFADEHHPSRQRRKLLCGCRCVVIVIVLGLVIGAGIGIILWRLNI